MKYFFLCLIFLASCTPQSSGKSKKRPVLPVLGQSEDFSLPTLDGQRVSLKQFQGKVLLLHFWASWCTPCLPEMRALVRLKERFEGSPFEILALSVDQELGPVRDFVRRLHPPFPVLQDLSNSVQNAYQVQQLPQSFFIDKQGYIRGIFDPQGEQWRPSLGGSRDWESELLLSQLIDLIEE
jgi:peroxiredoxin